MSSYDALEAFSGAIIDEAEKEKSILLDALRKEMENKIKSREKELSAMQERAVGSEMGRLVVEKGVSVSKIKNEGKKHLIEKRKEIFQAVFEGVTQNVRSYTKTAAYKERLVADYEAVRAEIGTTSYTLYTMPGDTQLLEGAKSIDHDIVGGFILEAPEKGLYYDCSLLAKIKEQESYFYANSGLVID